MNVIRLLWTMALAGALAGCGAGFGRDGSVHPDITAGVADYTGQGDNGEGWIGNSDGEGGPSAETPPPNSMTAH